MKTQKSDCDILLDNAENMFGSLGICIDTVTDDKKTKMNVLGSIFGLGKSITKLTFNAGYCAIKNTPKAVVAVAAVKREIITAATAEYNRYQKQIKKDTLDAKIQQLKLKV
jgi:putative N-acetylmannosamine-6-phosphate epimerase